MPDLNNLAALAGRLLMSAIFLIAGTLKIVHYDFYSGYMDKMGVPHQLLPLVILTEIGGGLLLVLGWQMRWVAFLLGGFTLLSGLFFHNNFADPNQMNHFLKNIAIVGGFIILWSNGAGAWSLDGRRAAA